MSRRWVQVAVGLAALLAAAQFVRPGVASPPTDASHTIQAQLGTANDLAAVLDRSCGDCHSNRVVSRWYTQVAPLSWLMAYSVGKGRKTLNFSEWASYPPEQQRQLLVESCADVSHGKMPGAYTAFRPDVRLSAQEVEVICAAARQAEAKPR